MVGFTLAAHWSNRNPPVGSEVTLLPTPWMSDNPLRYSSDLQLSTADDSNSLRTSQLLAPQQTTLSRVHYSGESTVLTSVEVSHGYWPCAYHTNVRMVGDRCRQEVEPVAKRNPLSILFPHRLACLSHVRTLEPVWKSPAQF